MSHDGWSNTCNWKGYKTPSGHILYPSSGQSIDIHPLLSMHTSSHTHQSIDILAIVPVDSYVHVIYR